VYLLILANSSRSFHFFILFYLLLSATGHHIVGAVPVLYTEPFGG